MLAGNGDGNQIITTTRYPIPSSRKFTPTVKNRNLQKLRLEHALKDLEKTTVVREYKKKNKPDSVSVDTPIKKSDSQSLRYHRNEEINIFASPRYSSGHKQALELQESGRILFKLLLLNAWRKSRNQISNLSNELAVANIKTNQLSMQVEVLQKLRKSESSRCKNIMSDFRLAQNKLEEMERECLEFKKNNEKLNNLLTVERNTNNEANEELTQKREALQVMEPTLVRLKEDHQKEKEHSKKLALEIDNMVRKSTELENKINTQKKVIDNLTNILECSRSSERSLEKALQQSKEDARKSADNLSKQVSLIAENQMLITKYKEENMSLRKELNEAHLALANVMENLVSLECENDKAKKELFDISNRLEYEKMNTKWNIFKKSAFKTYLMGKYVISLFMPALLPNLRFQ